MILSSWDVMIPKSANQKAVQDSNILPNDEQHHAVP